MSALVLFLLKAGFLAVLWLFVLGAVLVVRRDLSAARSGASRPVTVANNRPTRTERRKARAERRAAPGHLVVTQGSLAGTRIPLGDAPITIGRANDSTLVLVDDYVSTRHARLARRDGEWVVEDLGSTNGTYLERERVSGPTKVPVGVPIRVGKTVMELRR